VAEAIVTAAVVVEEVAIEIDVVAEEEVNEVVGVAETAAVESVVVALETTETANGPPEAITAAIARRLRNNRARPTAISAAKKGCPPKLTVTASCSPSALPGVLEP